MNSSKSARSLGLPKKDPPFASCSRTAYKRSDVQDSQKNFSPVSGRPSWVASRPRKPQTALNPSTSRNNGAIDRILALDRFYPQQVPACSQNPHPALDSRSTCLPLRTHCLRGAPPCDPTRTKMDPGPVRDITAPSDSRPPLARCRTTRSAMPRLRIQCRLSRSHHRHPQHPPRRRTHHFRLRLPLHRPRLDAPRPPPLPKSPLNLSFLRLSSKRALTSPTASSSTAPKPLKSCASQIAAHTGGITKVVTLRNKYGRNCIPASN